MKRFFGLCILVILLVAASGCTQPAQTAIVTPEPTADMPAEVPTTEATMPVATVEETSAPIATPEMTEEVTTVITTATTPKPVMTPSTKITTIYIRNNTFVPQELTVLPGTGITWVNEDKTVHTIKTLPTTTIKFSSSDLVPGASFGYTFGENEGSYGFFDTYTNATGVVIVKKGESVVGVSTRQIPVQTTTTV
jgi:plastocyanin